MRTRIDAGVRLNDLTGFENLLEITQAVLEHPLAVLAQEFCDDPAEFTCGRPVSQLDVDDGAAAAWSRFEINSAGIFYLRVLE